MNPFDGTVSVIVPTYNRARYVGECLDSLLAQTVSPLEIIVVDDGSEDETPQVLAHYGDAIHVVRIPNGGKPAAVNLGLELARGRWIWIFDDDDVALPLAIEARLAALAKQPEAGFVYGPHHLGSDDQDGRILRGKLYEPPQPPPDAFFFELMAACFFHLNSGLVERRCYEQIGGFDPGMLRGQDYDVQVRLARHFVPAYCSTPIFVFRQHTGARGPKALRGESASRGAVFRRFSEGIGQKIRRDVPLSEFCVPRAAPCNLRQAMLNRLHVMANHGCAREMLDDLETLVTLADREGGLTAEEVEGIAQAVCRGWAEPALAENWSAVLVRLQAIRQRPNGRDAIAGLRRGYLRLARSYPGGWVQRLLRVLRGARLASASWP